MILNKLLYILIIYYQYLLLLMHKYMFHISIKMDNSINQMSERMILLQFPI